MQCPTCYRTCDEQDSFCSGCDYCFVCDKKECECDKDFTDMSTVNELADERNAMRDEVAGLKRKLAEVEGERDALRECGDKLNACYELNSILYKALENIANQGHAFDGATNADLANRALKLYCDRQNINIAETLFEWNDANLNSPAK